MSKPVNSIQTEINNLIEQISVSQPSGIEKISETINGLTDDQKYYYLLGYSDSIHTARMQLPDIEIIEKAICQLRTKYTDKILLYLYKEGKCYHGDLAAKKDIQLSSSGLTAVIKKICTCQIPLIEIMKKGKFKIYSLTDAGKIYVEERLLHIKERNVPTSSSEYTSESKITTNAVNHQIENNFSDESEENGNTLTKSILQEMYQEAVRIFERKEQKL